MQTHGALLPSDPLSPRRFARLTVAVLLLLGAPGCRGGAPSADSIERNPSYQDKALLERAWQLPEASRYLGGFVSQPHMYDCGPITLVDVMHSRGDGAMTESALIDRGGLHVWNVMTGLNLDALAGLANRAGLHATVLRDLTLPQFRAELRKTNSPSLRYTINFTRRPLFGRGGGHHSPIGGYLEDQDLVFVLDVNDHFRPWLVSSERLYRALDTIDGDGGKKRGLLRIEASPN